VEETQGDRFVSVHPLTAYPVVVDVTRELSAALEHWRRVAVAIGVGVGGGVRGGELFVGGLARGRIYNG